MFKQIFLKLRKLRARKREYRKKNKWYKDNQWKFIFIIHDVEKFQYVDIRFVPDEPLYKLDNIELNDYIVKEIEPLVEEAHGLLKNNKIKEFLKFMKENNGCYTLMEK